MTREDALELLARLCDAHSPSGREEEINPLILDCFRERGHEPEVDAAGNIYVVRPGTAGGRIIVTAHKDEIGLMIKRINHDGRLDVRPVGGAHPWVYGEGPVDILGDAEIVTGILSFGSRHTSAETPNYELRHSPVTWGAAWIETFRSPAGLDHLGVHIGTKVVVSRERKRPTLLGDHVAAFGLDDKAALVILFDVLDRLGEQETKAEVVFAVTSEEETGVMGASWLASRLPADIMIAIEIAPVADEYHTICDERPVILMGDSHNLYDERVARELTTAAGYLELGVQYACLSGFGSDASLTARYGHTARPACVGFPTENTHGYEIAHVGGILNTARLITEYLRQFA